jgi:hypothetical protein
LADNEETNMKPGEVADLLGVHVDDLHALVRAADTALQEYGSDEQARAARRAAEALGFEFRNDHGLPEHQ